MALSDVEISALRSELVHHSSHILDVTKVAVTAVTVLIGFGLSRPAPQSALIALLPLLILWPSFTIVRNRRMNVMRCQRATVHERISNQDGLRAESPSGNALRKRRKIRARYPDVFRDENIIV